MPNIKKPKMVIFDYGHTLVYEADYDNMSGAEALLQHTAPGGRAVTKEEFNEISSEIYNMGQTARGTAMEIEFTNMLRFTCEFLGLTLTLSYREAEEVFWDAAAPGEAMGHIVETLRFLRDNGYRTGVISNISFCGHNLKRRIDKCIPGNNFEFIMASSDYIVRKPHPLLFKLALNKAGLSPDEAWYCGDSPDFDVAGAASAGIFPVWYHSTRPCYYRKEEDIVKPTEKHLYIREWIELIKEL